jgi:hypothetical protein
MPHADHRWPGSGTEITLRWLLLKRVSAEPKCPILWIQPCKTPADAIEKHQKLRALGVRILAPLLQRRRTGWDYAAAYSEA